MKEEEYEDLDKRLESDDIQFLHEAVAHVKEQYEMDFAASSHLNLVCSWYNNSHGARFSRVASKKTAHQSQDCQRTELCCDSMAHL